MATSGDSTGPAEPADRGTALPPVLELLWGRRQRGRRATGLSIDAIVDAAISIADAEGLAGVSMAKVASALGFTTMSLYRHVSGKDELLALMWNASAAGIPTITGDGWRQRLQNWALAQMHALQRRTWILDLPMATPPAGPNSLAWVEQAMAALADSPLYAGERLGVVGLLSTFVLGEARMAHDSAIFREANGAGIDFAQVLRTVADEERFPQLYRAAWSGELGRPDAGEDGGDSPPDWADDLGFMFGLERILDSVELLIERRGPARGGAEWADSATE
jgi:AcrR family transcriptional regulator